MRWTVWASVACLSVGLASAGAQDPAATEADAPSPPAAEGSAEQPVADPAGDPVAEPAADPATEPAADPAAPAADVTPVTAADFEGLFTEWKALLARLRELRAQYQTATTEQRTTIKQEWDGLIVQGEALMPRLIGSAEAAYATAPSANPELTELLEGLVKRHVAAGELADALRIGKLLLDNGDQNTALYEPVASAAFYQGDYAAAEQYLQLAQDNAQLSDTGQTMQAEIPIRQAEAQADDLPRVELVTSKGTIVLELFENEAPNTVANFISLVKSKFYDGLTFHRVLEGFVAQGGDPKGDGTGGPGYNIPCECYKPEFRRHLLGSLSMAHAGKDTGGSQFFITLAPTPNLDGKHTVFGRVVSGFDVLLDLQLRDPESASPLPDPDKIISATVVRDRGHAYEVTKLPE